MGNVFIFPLDLEQAKKETLEYNAKTSGTYKIVYKELALLAPLKDLKDCVEKLENLSFDTAKFNYIIDQLYELMLKETYTEEEAFLFLNLMVVYQANEIVQGRSALYIS